MEVPRTEGEIVMLLEQYDYAIAREDPATDEAPYEVMGLQGGVAARTPEEAMSLLAAEQETDAEYMIDMIKSALQCDWRIGISLLRVADSLKGEEGAHE